MWTTGYAPGATDPLDKAYVRNGGILTVDSPTHVFADLNIGETGTSSGTVNVVTGGVLAPTGIFSVGRTGTGGGFGYLNINGGTVTKTGTIVVGSGSRTGTVSITSGTLSASLEFGTTTNATDANDRFRIIGSTANISGTDLTVGAGSIVDFVFDSTGIATLNYSGTAKFYTGSQIIIDGSAYAGGANTFTLIDAGTLGTATSPTISLIGFDPKYEADYSYNGTLDTLTVTVIPEPATIGMLGLGALAVMAIRRYSRS